MEECGHLAAEDGAGRAETNPAPQPVVIPAAAMALMAASWISPASSSK